MTCFLNPLRLGAVMAIALAGLHVPSVRAGDPHLRVLVMAGGGSLPHDEVLAGFRDHLAESDVDVEIDVTATTDAGELRSALETVEATTSDLSGMVDSLLLLAEIDDQRFQPRLSEFDPREWIRSMVDFYTPLFEERGTTLTSHVDAKRITGDRRLLDRVLVNLLENALQHTGPGDRVEIRAENSRGFRLSLDDSGPGIDAHDRQRVFDRFVRIDPDGRNGSGLGLALARAIARLHGGDLVAEPSPLGGTRLELRVD